MARRLAGVVLTPVGAGLLVVGLLTKVRSRRELVFHVWFLALVIYVLLVPEGNRSLVYYQLPFVPVCAALAGKALGGFLDGRLVAGISRSVGVRRTVVAMCLAAIVWQSYAYAQPLLAAQPYYAAQLEIGREVDALLHRLAHAAQRHSLALELGRRVAVHVGRSAHLAGVPQGAALVGSVRPPSSTCAMVNGSWCAMSTRALNAPTPGP